MAYRDGIDPNHQKKRGVLRVAGVIILLTGIVMLIIGMVDFFGAASHPFGMGTINMEGPKMFWLNFIAIPLIFVGVVMTSSGFMGAMARYQAQEIAPVGKDTINYMAEGTKESVKVIAHSIKEGLSEVDDHDSIVCGKCGKNNPKEAAFCNGCGAPFESTICSRCGYKNPSDASFCNGCGAKLG